MKITSRIITAGLAAGAMVLGLAAPALAGPSSSNEHLILSFSSFSGGQLSGTVVASGAVSGVGTVVAGQGNVFPVTVTLPQGTLKLKVTSGPSDEIPNLNTCSIAFTGTDTIKVTGGTGAFAGASGTGTDTNRGGLIFPRNPDGSCNFNADPKTGIVVFADLHV